MDVMEPLLRLRRIVSSLRTSRNPHMLFLLLRPPAPGEAAEAGLFIGLVAADDPVDEAPPLDLKLERDLLRTTTVLSSS